MNKNVDSDLYPPPWNDMKAECFIFLTYTRSHSIPSSWSDPLGSTSTGHSQDRCYVGGIGTVMIIRYLETPCGKNSFISRLARFRFFSARDRSSQLCNRVEVSSMKGKTPFFSVSLKRKLAFISLPVDSKYIPLNVELVHPPLSNTEDVQITENYISVTPHLRGWFSFVSGEGKLKGGKWGDGVHFPDIFPISVGFCSPAMVINFPAVLLFQSISDYKDSALTKSRAVMWSQDMLIRIASHNQRGWFGQRI
ncbi:unnamed protein product [Albugo candida]|uniref:Uncharacterized protein n=1 Tax=Albugo candida TaxID=65357 RepID=A0A024FUF0_9STRA|nr:unnamed protein product [Albugo candida]|eukprot:CCI10661.1 unnamed protein product [Albugo candida]